MIVFDGFTAQAGSPTIPDKSIIASQPKADSNIFFESERIHQLFLVFCYF